MLAPPRKLLPHSPRFSAGGCHGGGCRSGLKAAQLFYWPRLLSFRSRINFLETLAAALRLTPDGFLKPNQNKEQSTNETVFACAGCYHAARCRRNESSQSRPNADSSS